jgi:hypothetical protein
MINCKHWSDCRVRGGGCCALGLYGGKPSEGTCTRACKKRDPVGVDEPSPESQPLSFVSKAVSYVRAEVSLLTQFIPESKVEERLDACRACPSLKPSTEPDQFGWCGACGCGKNKRAELTVKARMPAATCPKKLWP